MPSVPFDIVETIIDILAQKDANLTATKTCSLVSRSFLHICRKHIFASFSLNDFYSRPTRPYVYIHKTTSYEFRQLLTRTPEIADYIRHLKCFITLDDLEFFDLVPGLKKIRRLQSLTLSNNIGEQLLWDIKPLRQALIHLIHLPTLVELSLYSVDDFVVADLPSDLRKLTFGGLDVLRSSSPSKLPPSPIKFRAISVEYESNSTIAVFCTAKCRDGRPIIDFAVLTRLTFKLYDSDDLESLRNLLSHCTGLVYVQIEVPEKSLPLVGLHSMLAPSMQTLKHLDVQGIFKNGDTDPYCGIADELEQMGTKNVIEHIQIKITISVNAECTRGDKWSRLDKVLTQSAWPDLQRVSLTIIVVTHPREDSELEEELWELPMTQLTELASRKLLSFRFKVEEKRV